MAADVQPEVETVAAVIVTRNRQENLRHCLETLLAQTYPLSAVFVVDNSSTDGTAEMVKGEFSQAIYHRLPDNVGSGGGYRTGLGLAFEQGASWLWAIDDEVVLEPDVLERMMARVAQPRRVADILLPAEFDPQTGRSRVHMAWYGPLIHRDVVATIGLPMEEFFFWAADAEFFGRARSTGKFKILRAPDIVVTHDKRNPDVREAKRHPSRLYYQTRNTIYIRRHIQRSPYGTVRSLVWVALGRAAKVIFSREPRKLQKTVMILRGALDGLRGRLGKTVEIG